MVGIASHRLPVSFMLAVMLILRGANVFFALQDALSTRPS